MEGGGKDSRVLRGQEFDKLDEGEFGADVGREALDSGGWEDHSGCQRDNRRVSGISRGEEHIGRDHGSLYVGLPHGQRGSGDFLGEVRECRVGPDLEALPPVIDGGLADRCRSCKVSGGQDQDVPRSRNRRNLGQGFLIGHVCCVDGAVAAQCLLGLLEGTLMPPDQDELLCPGTSKGQSSRTTDSASLRKLIEVR